jgi:hypothetical protein
MNFGNIFVQELIWVKRDFGGGKPKGYVRFWHLADIPQPRSSVRSWGKADMTQSARNVR